MRTKFRSLQTFILAWLAVLFAGGVAAEGLKVYSVPPKSTDSALQHFLSNNLVINPPGADRGLLVFLPGTAAHELPEGGKPFPLQRVFMKTAAELGYRVIGLQYDNAPAVMKVCIQVSNSRCTASVREKRIFGDNRSDLINDTPAESIESRLTHLLEFLAKRQPRQDWGQFLANDAPRWDRIAFAGHSQGAGMAAYIAKKREVARVILLSGPIDYLSDLKTPAPWLSTKSATPPDRWFGFYHAREKGAHLLAASYSALHIPPSHVKALNGDPVPFPGRNLADPYHASMIVDKMMPRDQNEAPIYEKDWRAALVSDP